MRNLLGLSKSPAIAPARLYLYSIILLGLLSIGMIVPFVHALRPISTNGSKPIPPNNQTYSGSLIGFELWLNTSFPFQEYASTSRILGLSAVQTFVSGLGYSISDLRPYLSLYPSGGNPYDFAQLTVTVKGSTTYVYEYILPNQEVVGVWVPEDALGTVTKLFTYYPDTALQGATNNYLGAGVEAHDTSQYGAVYETQIWGDLASPSTCGSDCWYWDDWLGTNNYDWPSGISNAFFFQGEILYWGGNEGQPGGNCGSSAFSPQNCEFFQYVLDGGSLQTQAPGIGGWTNGDGVDIVWDYGNSNCTPQGGGGGNTVDEEIEDIPNSVSTTDSQCFPTSGNPYSDFIGERIGSTENPVFNTNPHSLTGFMYDGNLNPIPLNSGGSGQPEQLNLYTHNLSTELVASGSVSSGQYMTTWDDTWDASSDQ